MRHVWSGYPYGGGPATKSLGDQFDVGNSGAPEDDALDLMLRAGLDL